MLAGDDNDQEWLQIERLSVKLREAEARERRDVCDVQNPRARGAVVDDTHVDCTGNTPPLQQFCTNAARVGTLQLALEVEP